MIEIEKEKPATGIYYIEMDYYKHNLEYLIEGIEYSIKRISEDLDIFPDGALEIEILQESVYGTAFIAMQNYIDLTIAEFYKATYIAEFTKPLEAPSLTDYAEKARKNDVICKNNKTYIELINALANSYKHRNELEVYLERIMYIDNSENKSQKTDKNKVYHKNTNDVLSTFGLLAPDNNDYIWPASKGILILDKDYNLKNIIQHLFKYWRPRMYNMFLESKNN